jgi:hypothetical protein
MNKRERIRQDRLPEMESEFHSLLLSCLAESASGRWGLFGQNAHLDPQDRHWKWPEAKRLRTLAVDIRSELAESGERNTLCEKFIGLCEDKDSNTLGEPRLAAAFLEEIQTGS